MAEPLVSIKMITYNHAPYIAQAIEGVLAQKTKFPFELVIGEDCSNDGTREIIFEYQQKYPDIIQVISSDKNMGMKKNSRRTAAVCRGKYIAFCEGDDYWHNPDKLQRQVDYMENHPECGMVFSDCNVQHVSANRFMNRVRYSDGYQRLAKINIEQIIGYEKIAKWPWTCTAMVRNDLRKNVIEADPCLHQSDKFLLGDVQLWAELSLISEVIYMPECFATYRCIDESASNSLDARKRMRFSISVAEMKLYLCDKHKLPESLRRKVEMIWCEKCLYLAFYDRNTELALKVKKRKKTFTCKEWLRFFGAKYLLVQYAYLAAISLRNLYQK